ncbi:Holliday junction branch migration protein RuvA [Ignatzschineria ureiclastica]|uniref:Holliday junction branch migration complex subunit RuvA n=1 Tax=Ignatzschineria ureiclastica TaxID=472582 RepID=A0A2U2AFP7_9GAMM|nr:Holliday junction branch migration protein RuvA [Ignatzschineria ureiclastica]PWD81488.1 Holliday junction branch migration protein RuvA [Ignatzschineria ureiclastica]GHA01042.1 Holliday junction ATP-dependent DNA helicase RuvA [Ignatzschineria ureiclastica]
MIGRLTGILAEKRLPNQALVDVNGVGYEVELPMSSFAQLPQEGEKVQLTIHHVVREDASLLYGFSSPKEREAFRLLIKVSGIGPKSAILILSGLSAEELYRVINRDDLASLTKVPGVGKKTAERLIIELRDKVKNLAPAAGFDDLLGGTEPIMTDPQMITDDAIEALVSLGYNQTEAKKRVMKVAKPGLTLEMIIPLALKL